MFKITIIAIGSVKTDYFRKGIEEYLKRLSPYAKVAVEEIRPEPFFDSSDHNKIKKSEGEKILRALEKYRESKIIILHEIGKEFESKEFSEFLDKNSRDHIVFVIGGALGLSEDALNFPGSFRLSLSKMTLPHEMARLILAEQIYRAIVINKNKKYHY
ncbi:MAG: 23S rRNA (pseudouridine(1915)-N(3))-methyltransferase RlmH [Candidatus Moranbacteria bacterium]|jgi:23S rRNA (pseudouridine1915-N3)-methyltransferase|nr:23S rRNA (pseudouridine(1915)-N(3))-methyltransferase RlmH [Candidatus Moranbacteria bacterium]MDD5652197.1 23S rRNA (pseudouridine(1915)-N(3))-methyltransferase RlmH [Candidatus Moranbacteria bacterium]MDX9855904.1 23S rRNA (pseudouridine(1915)-N(3))-methyltransferase RlmH [Candidatus Moranbacteria bacterium]